METSIREELEDVEGQLVKVGLEIEDLLRMQEELQERKELLQVQLRSLELKTSSSTHCNLFKPPLSMQRCPRRMSFSSCPLVGGRACATSCQPSSAKESVSSSLPFFPSWRIS